MGARGRSQSQRQQGFTLLELMVVVLIMGLGLGLIALAIGGDDTSLAREEAESFLLRSNFVAEQALLGGQVIGMFVEARGRSDTTDPQWCYRWQRLRGNAWEPLTEDLEERCLPLSLQMDMLVENEPYEYDPDLEEQPPVLVFYPSGEATVFELAIYEANPGSVRDPEQIQRIQVDMMGGIHWVNREAELAAARGEP